MIPPSPKKKSGMSKVFLADLQILFASLLFGIGFIGQRAVSIEGLEPMTCNALRFGLSSLFLYFFGHLIPNPTGPHTKDEHQQKDEEKQSLASELSLHSTEQSKCSYFMSFFSRDKIWLSSMRAGDSKKSVLYWGVLLGVINFMGSGFQQWGIKDTSAGKVGFLAGFDIFLTPMLALCVPSMKRNAKPSTSTWVAVAVSMLGLFLLSGTSMVDMEIGFGESLVIVSTIFWTLHITYTDIATSYVDSLQMLHCQFCVVAIISGAIALCIESQAIFMNHILFFAPWIVFLAVTEGLAFQLIVQGQHYSPPTHVAIIISLEGVFSAIFGFFILREVLSPRECFGCVMMLFATYIAKHGDSGGVASLESSSKDEIGLLFCGPAQFIRERCFPNKEGTK